MRGPKLTGPEFLNIDYAQFVSPPVNRYTQYRMYIEVDENTASVLESNITKFANDHGVGELEVNAYLASDASQNMQCSVNSIDVKYE